MTRLIAAARHASRWLHDGADLSARLADTDRSLRAALATVNAGNVELRSALGAVVKAAEPDPRQADRQPRRRGAK